MDEADYAQANTEFLESVLPRKHKPVAQATGFCLYCGEPVPPGKRWCDEECHAEWEEEQRIKRRKEGQYGLRKR